MNILRSLAMRLAIVGLLLGPIAIMPSWVVTSAQAATQSIYKPLGARMTPASSTSVTCTNASPMVCTWTNSNFAAGDQFFFVSGTPPTGGCSLALSTIYFVISAGLGTSTFELSATLGGSACNSTSTGTTLVGSAYTVVYQVPASTQTVVSAVYVCNQTASVAAFRLALAPSNGAVAAKNILAYDMTVPGNDCVVLPSGLTMTNGGTGDTLLIYGGTATISVNVFGSEIS